MALITSASKCAICGEPLEGRDFVATWGVFIHPDDPLSRFCDAGMHWACYAPWRHRDRFARAYVDMWVANERGNAFWGKVYIDEYVFMTVNPYEPVAEVSIKLFATGTDFRVKLCRWEEWLATAPAEITPRELEQDVLRGVMPVIGGRFSNRQSLLDAYDFAHKEAIQQKREAERTRTRDAMEREIQEHNSDCLELQREGVVCPHCKHGSVRFMDGRNSRKSYWICEGCERSFRKHDLVEV